MAYRTSCFKDWFAKIDNTSGNGVAYTNNLYSVVAAATAVGWKFTSSDGKIVKTITLPAGKGQLAASYTTTGYVQLYVRFGLIARPARPAPERPEISRQPNEQHAGR